MVLLLFSSDSTCKLHILLSGYIFNWSALSTVNNCKKMFGTVTNTYLIVFFPLYHSRSIFPPGFQNEDVFCVSQNRVCGGPLPLHGRVQSAAGGVWCGDKESRSGADSSGSCVQVPLDLCGGMLHGVLPDTVWYLSKGQTGQHQKKKTKRHQITWLKEFNKLAEKSVFLKASYLFLFDRLTTLWVIQSSTS